MQDLTSLQVVLVQTMLMLIY